MKLNKSNKKKPSSASVEEREEKIAELEARYSELSECIGQLREEAQLIVKEASEQAAAKVNEFYARFMERQQQLFERSEENIVARVIEFFEACPFWEFKKLTFDEQNKGDTAKMFNDLVKAGWRYVGQRFDKNGSGRYDMFVRQKGKPISREEYLKLFAEFQSSAKEDSKKTPEAAPSAKKKKLKVNKK